MNCKSGDLAYIVPPAQLNVGRVVEVLSLAEPMDGWPAWWVCATGKPLLGVRDGSEKVVATDVARCPDDCLRPISGIPLKDDVTTEQPIEELA